MSNNDFWRRDQSTEDRYADITSTSRPTDSDEVPPPLSARPSAPLSSEQRNLPYTHSLQARLSRIMAQVPLDENEDDARWTRDEHTGWTSDEHTGWTSDEDAGYSDGLMSPFPPRDPPPLPPRPLPPRCLASSLQSSSVFRDIQSLSEEERTRRYASAFHSSTPSLNWLVAAAKPQAQNRDLPDRSEGSSSHRPVNDVQSRRLESHERTSSAIQQFPAFHAGHTDASTSSGSSMLQQADRKKPYNEGKAIQKLKAIIHEIKTDHTTVNTLLPLIIAKDIIEYLPKVEKLLSLYERGAIEDFKNSCQMVLEDRWNKVKNTPLCYSLNKDYPMNMIFRLLAKLISPEKSNQLLMPTVSITDTSGNELNKMNVGEFVITEGGDHFICIEDFIDASFERAMNKEQQIYVITHADGSAKALSSSEMALLQPIITKIEKEKRKIGRLDQKNIYEELCLLRDGLKKGDASARERWHLEYDAGSDANEALVRFNLFFNTLDESIQDQLLEIQSGSYSFREIMGRLNRTEANVLEDIADEREHIAPRFCVQMTGGHLETLVERNKQAILDLGGSGSLEKVRTKKAHITEWAKSAGGVNAFINATPSVRSIQNEITHFVKINLPKYAESNSLDYCLYEMTCFVLNRFDSIDTETKTALTTASLCYYTDVLIAIGIESSDFAQKERSIQKLILHDIFTRISMIDMRSKNDTSAWQVFISTKLAETFLGTLSQNSAFEYIQTYPLEKQRVITNEEIERLQKAYFEGTQSETQLNSPRNR